MGQACKVEGKWPLSCLKLSLHSDLKYAPVQICDSYVHSYDAIALTNLPSDRHTNTWQYTQNTSYDSSRYDMCHRELILP